MNDKQQLTHKQIYLVGLMGAGKTTVGRKLAQHLELAFIDTDQLLEQRTGVSVSHIFAVEGESGFRRRETKILQEISGTEPAVIATGGGIILAEENRTMMRAHGRTVYLHATAEVLCQRLRDRQQNRPLVADIRDGETLAMRMITLLAAREPLYRAQAELVIEVNDSPAFSTMRNIAHHLQSDASEWPGG